MILVVYILAVSRGGNLLGKNSEKWTKEVKERINDKFSSNGMGSMHFIGGIWHKCIHVNEDGVICKAFPDEIPIYISKGYFEQLEPHLDENGI